MTPDDFLKWSIKLQEKFEKNDAEKFLVVIDAVIESEIRISQKIKYTYERIDSDAERNIMMRDGIKKRLTKENIE